MEPRKKWRRNLQLITFGITCNLLVGAQTPEFGVHWGNAAKGTPPQAFNTVLATLDSDTVRWVRCEIPWNEIHVAPGTFLWYQIESNIRELVDSGFNVIADLKSTPSWYTTNNTGDPLLDPYFAPQDTLEWVIFVDSVTTRLKDKVKHWEIWSEPDGGGFRTTTPLQKHRKYRDLLASAYVHIKALDPAAEVLVGGFTTNLMSDPMRRLFLDSLFAVSFQDYFDIMNIHAYENIFELKTLVDTMESKGIGEDPIWITETNPWRELVPENSEAGTAAFLCGWIKDSLISGFDPQVICWFNLRNFVSTNPPQICDTCDPNLTAYGLLTSEYLPTLVLPAYYACYSELLTRGEIPIEKEPLSLYPNPGSEVIFLLSSIPGKHHIAVFDCSGRIRREYNPANVQGTPFALAVSDLPAGIYIVKIASADRNVVKRILVFH